jgi:hypothetical protein
VQNIENVRGLVRRHETEKVRQAFRRRWLESRREDAANPFETRDAQFRRWLHSWATNQTSLAAEP